MPTKRRDPLQFKVGDFVYLRVSPTRGVQRFGIKRKLAPRYVRPFEIIEACGPVAYRIRLPSQLAAIHDVFHIAQLKKCIKVPTEIIKPQDIEIEPDLSYAEYPIRVLDTKERSTKKERSTRREKVKMYKIQWNHHTEEEATGRLKCISKEIFPTFLEPIQVPNLSVLILSVISGRDSF